MSDTCRTAIDQYIYQYSQKTIKNITRKTPTEQTTETLKQLQKEINDLKNENTILRKQLQTEIQQIHQGINQIKSETKASTTHYKINNKNKREKQKIKLRM
ncbi:MAG: hypothetical protein R6V50_01320 [Thermoplasmatota archaeon]